MKYQYILSTCLSIFLLSGAAQAQCGDVEIAGFSWQSSEALAYVDAFILDKGYDCNATVVRGETVPTITSMIEKGRPDLASEIMPSLAPALFAEASQQGRVKQIGVAISDSAVSGWYMPQYFSEAHSEIKTIDDALARPDLFPSSDDPSKGGIFLGAEGWGDTIVTANIFKAFKAEEKGFILVPTGSGAGLDGAIIRAYEREQGFIAAYWQPTSLLAKYPMVRLEAGIEHDEAEWSRCTTVTDFSDPKPNYWKIEPVVTLISDRFAERDDAATVMEYLEGRRWDGNTVSHLMAWMSENQATGDEAARYFLKNYQDVWVDWVPADIAEKIKSAL